MFRLPPRGFPIISPPPTSISLSTPLSLSLSLRFSASFSRKKGALSQLGEEAGEEEGGGVHSVMAYVVNYVKEFLDM